MSDREVQPEWFHLETGENDLDRPGIMLWQIEGRNPYAVSSKILVFV